jgi:hypothetical protein
MLFYWAWKCDPNQNGALCLLFLSPRVTQLFIGDINQYLSNLHYVTSGMGSILADSLTWKRALLLRKHVVLRKANKRARVGRAANRCSVFGL